MSNARGKPGAGAGAAAGKGAKSPSPRPPGAGITSPSAGGAGGAGAGAADAHIPPGLSAEEKAKIVQDYVTQSEDAQVLRQNLRDIVAALAHEESLTKDYLAQKSMLEHHLARKKTARDERKMELREKLREKSEMEERCAQEVKVYKEKVKHLLGEQTAHISERKIEEEVKRGERLHDERAHELERKDEERLLGNQMKEMEVQHMELVNTLRQEQEAQIMRLREEYERRGEQMKNNYEKRMKAVREEYEEKKKEQVHKLETKKNAEIQDLMAKHKRKFDKIKKYFSDITHANLELIKNLKEEVGDMKKKESALTQEVLSIRRENARLSSPLQAHRTTLLELRDQLQEYRVIRVNLVEGESECMVMERLIKEKQWEMELMRQKMKLVREEQDEWRKKYMHTCYTIQQQISFRSLLLAKQLTALSAELEKTEAALSELLLSTNLHPGVCVELKRGLEEVLRSKNAQIQAFEDQVEESRARYEQVKLVYAQACRQNGVPEEEMGFVAAVL